MASFFITRHPGAHEWIKQQGIEVDKCVEHFDMDMIRADDVVIGTLPVNIAARVCERGARYLHLSLSLPAELRGVELTAQQMSDCDARIEEFDVRRVRN
ncbi:MAG: CRISPR-associated protein Csx16 [Gammaproteobacteria bacterium]|nr:CRISPR-associated protein Csx16 [Gammaproteobacteria bacterium]